MGEIRRMTRFQMPIPRKHLAAIHRYLEHPNERVRIAVQRILEEHEREQARLRVAHDEEEHAYEKSMPAERDDAASVEGSETLNGEIPF